MPRRSIAAFDLKAARQTRGVSQLEAAEILCTTQPSVSRWEAEGNMPAVYRKVWMQHWQLEKLTHGKHDKRTDKRSRESLRVGKVVRKSKAGTKTRDKGLRTANADSAEVMPGVIPTSGEGI